MRLETEQRRFRRKKISYSCGEAASVGPALSVVKIFYNALTLTERFIQNSRYIKLVVLGNAF